MVIQTMLNDYFKLENTEETLYNIFNFSFLLDEELPLLVFFLFLIVLRIGFFLRRLLGLPRFVPFQRGGRDQRRWQLRRCDGGGQQTRHDGGAANVPDHVRSPPQMGEALASGRRGVNPNRYAGAAGWPWPAADPSLYCPNRKIPSPVRRTTHQSHPSDRVRPTLRRHDCRPPR